jgi:hypothetical protein
MVKDVNTNAAWRRVFGPENKRAKDEELIVRFFAMYDDGGHFYKPMIKFLNYLFRFGTVLICGNVERGHCFLLFR